ncbi:MAG: TonB-dependent receptor, partial [Acidobacteria bacterium]|nr:TonB-dependent receptor [Acidobacteriota bacterium]
MSHSKSVTGPLVYVPTEATQEFTLMQNQYSAEFGHSTGGQFNTIVKGGTNQLHGSLYEYFQNKNLMAVDQSYVNSGIYKNPRYDQNKLGASVGGPIIKDKLFYFGNFEYGPLGTAYTPAYPVLAPTAAGYALLDKMSGISKTNYDIFKKYVSPAPTASDSTTVNGVTIPIGVLPTSGSFFNNYYTYVASVDYNPSSTDQIRGRFVWNRSDSLDNAASLPVFWTTLPQRFYLTSISHYHTFSPNVTNELRLAYNRYSQFYTVTDAKFPGLDVFPNLQMDNDLGIQIGPDPNAPQFGIQNTYQLVENINYAVLEEYLRDEVPSDQAQRNLGSTSYYGNQWATYLYANDNWRIKNNLTLNLGIRWERTTVPLGMGLQKLNAISNVNGLIDFRAPKTNSKAFAPRLGIAYSPGTDGKTSIRAGIGMGYDVIFDNVGSTAYPPQLSSTYDAGDYPDKYKTPFLANGGIKPGSLSGGGNLNATDARQATSSYIPDQILPASVQWNFGVQRVFKNDYTVEVRYLGTHGYHLITQNRLNRKSRVNNPSEGLPTFLTAQTQASLDALSLTLAQINARPNYVSNWLAGGFNAASVVGFVPWGSSVYHGLATQLNRRFSNGLQLQAAYTWSHNMDNSTATHFSTVLSPRRPQDFRNLRNEWSSSPLDRRHRFTVNWY